MNSDLDNGIFMIISCKKYKNRLLAVNNIWRNKLNSFYKSFFIIGDPSIESDFFIDHINDTIYVKCGDEYDFLPHKVKLGLTAISTFNPNWVIKIDDDMILDIDKFKNWLSLNYNKADYLGHLQTAKEGWGTYQSERFILEKNKQRFFVKNAIYCAGPCYYLSKKAYTCLVENMDPEYCKLEDINVGTTLYYNNIIGMEGNTYTDHYNIFNSSSTYFSCQDSGNVLINDKNAIENNNYICLLNSGGGLGNQLFQVCTIYSYSKDNNAIPVLLTDYSETYRYNILYYKDTLLQTFLFSSSNNYRQCNNLWSEPNFYFNEIQPGFTKIKGYFQSYKYFNNRLPELRNIFHFNLKDIRKNMIQKWFHSISNNTCMVHIRRGDYTTQYKDIYYTVDEDYIQKALQSIQNSNELDICVFTDDFEYVKQWNVWKNYKTTFIEEDDALNTFVCMMECKHHIISNSSLSLSAALLSLNQNIKIAPSKWFKNYVQFKLEDLYPSNYILI